MSAIDPNPSRCRIYCPSPRRFSGWPCRAGASACHVQCQRSTVFVPLQDGAGEGKENGAAAAASRVQRRGGRSNDPVLDKTIDENEVRRVSCFTGERERERLLRRLLFRPVLDATLLCVVSVGKVATASLC